MPTTGTCPKCGATLSADSTEGLCPKCLLERGLETSTPGAPSSFENQTTVVGRGTEGERSTLNFQPSTSNAPDPEAPTMPGFQPPATSIKRPRIRYFGDYELLEEIARGGMGVVYN